MITETALRARVKEALDSKAITKADGERIIRQVETLHSNYGHEMRQRSREKLDSQFDSVFGLNIASMGWNQDKSILADIVQSELQTLLGHAPKATATPSKAPEPVAPKAPEKVAVKTSKPVATQSKPTASKPSTLASVLPMVKSAADLRIEAAKAELASKEAELAATMAKLRADMQAQHPGASAALVDEWITNKGGCRQTFCDDFKIFSAYRRNAS